MASNLAPVIAGATKVNMSLVLGSVIKLSSVGVKADGCAKVRIRSYEFDAYLTMYFAHHRDIWALDPARNVKVGDKVLVREMKTPYSMKIKHEIMRNVYPYGFSTNPITGRRQLNESDPLAHDKRQELIREMLGKNDKKSD